MVGGLRSNMATRWVTGIMQLFWIILASTLLPVHMQVTVRALIGQDVLLPCSCPPNRPGDLYLVWQIGQHTTVAYTFSSRDKAEIDRKYQNRTRLFYPADKGNCSLWLHRVRVSDENAYSCLYKGTQMINVTVALEVAATYSLQCSKNSNGEQYQCMATGGFPKGRVYWLQGAAVEQLQGPLSKLHSQDHFTGLYNITSTLRTNASTLQCVVENPTLQCNITATCTQEAQTSPAPSVSVELKTSLAVGSTLLLLAVLFLIVIKVWKPCPSSKVPGLYEPAPLAEGGTAGSPS